jgi:hypothetical protein
MARKNNGDPSMNLATIIKTHTPDYLLDQYCKHYSKYSFHKVFVKITSEDSNDPLIEKIEKHFTNHFSIVIFEYDLGKLYSIEGESKFYTKVMNSLEAEWLLMADIDEFIEIERIDDNVWETEESIPGILIDRISNQEFDPLKNIFDNYKEKYFLYNWKPVSYPFKESFVKKRKEKIEVGHHLWDPAKFINKKWCLINHFKWRKDSKRFLYKSRKNFPDKNQKAYHFNLDASFEILESKKIPVKYKVDKEVAVNPDHKSYWFFNKKIRTF